MKFFARVIGIGFLFLAPAVFADSQITVCQLGAEGDNDIFLMPCEGWVSQQNCPVGSWIHWDINNDADRVKVSNAQAALVSGKSIIVRVQGCSNDFDNVIMLRLVK